MLNLNTILFVCNYFNALENFLYAPSKHAHIRNIYVYLHFYGHHHPNRRVRRVGRLPKDAQIAKKAHTSTRACAQKLRDVCNSGGHVSSTSFNSIENNLRVCVCAHDSCSRPLFISNQNKHSFKYLTIYKAFYMVYIC